MATPGADSETTGTMSEWSREGHQNLDQASDQVERPALCRVIPPREEGCGCQKLGPQVPSSGSTKGGIRLRRKYKIPDHCLNRVFGHYELDGFHGEPLGSCQS